MSAGKRVTLPTGEVVLRLDKKTAAALDRLERSEASDFGALARAAGLDPARHFIGADLSGLPLGPSKSDLRGFDFSGADLRGTALRKAVVDATTRVDGAKLDAADRRALRGRAIVGWQEAAEPSEPFDLRQAEAMILVGKAPPRDWTSQITRLAFNGAKLSDLAPLRHLTSLQVLWLNDTQVIDLTPLKSLTALIVLSLSDTQVSDLAPLVDLISLRWLELIGTRVEDLAPLKDFKALERLDLTGTKVSSLAPLAGLSALQRLNLSGTKVVDLAPLARCHALRELYLINTKVDDLAPIAHLATLKRLSNVWVETDKRKTTLANTLFRHGEIVRNVNLF